MMKTATNIPMTAILIASVIKLIRPSIPFKTAITKAMIAKILPIIPAAAFIAIGIKLISLLKLRVNQQDGYNNLKRLKPSCFHIKHFLAIFPTLGSHLCRVVAVRIKIFAPVFGVAHRADEARRIGSPRKIHIIWRASIGFENIIS